MVKRVGSLVFIKDLPPDTSKQKVALNIEHLLTDEDVAIEEDDIEFGPDNECLVPLGKDVELALDDLQRMARTSGKPFLEKMTFCAVPRPRLLLYDLHKKHHEDVIELYFESSKCGNTEEVPLILPLMISGDGRTAIIEFSEDNVVDQVLAQTNHQAMGEDFNPRKCTAFTTLDNFHRELCHPRKSLAAAATARIDDSFACDVGSSIGDADEPSLQEKTVQQSRPTGQLNDSEYEEPPDVLDDANRVTKERVIQGQNLPDLRSRSQDSSRDAEVSTSSRHLQMRRGASDEMLDDDFHSGHQYDVENVVSGGKMKERGRHPEKNSVRDLDKQLTETVESDGPQNSRSHHMISRTSRHTQHAHLNRQQTGSTDYSGVPINHGQSPDYYPQQNTQQNPVHASHGNARRGRPQRSSSQGRPHFGQEGLSSYSAAQMQYGESPDWNPQQHAADSYGDVHQGRPQRRSSSQQRPFLGEQLTPSPQPLMETRPTQPDGVDDDEFCSITFEVTESRFSILLAGLKILRPLREVQTPRCTITRYSKQRNTFLISGIRRDVNAAKSAMLEAVDGMAHGEIQISLALARKLGVGAGRSALIDALRSQKPQICARVYTEDDKPHVVALQQRDYKNVLAFFRSEIVTKTITLQSEQKKRLDVLELKRCETNAAIVCITDEGIKIEGLKQQHVNDVSTKVHKIIPQSKSEKKTFRLGSTQWKLLDKYGKDKVDEILVTHGLREVKWHLHGSADNHPGIIFVGRQAALDFLPDIKDILKVHQEVVEIKQEGLTADDFFSHTLVPKSLKTVEQTFKCIIESKTNTKETVANLDLDLDMPDLPSGDQTSQDRQIELNADIPTDDEGDGHFDDGDDTDDEDDDLAEEDTEPMAPKISNIDVVRGDIAKHDAQVLVNTVANDNSDLSKCGALSKSFVDAGGPSFQQDFTNNIGQVSGGMVVHQQNCDQTNYSNLYRRTAAVFISPHTSQAKHGTLKCEYVFHMGIRDWNKGSRNLMSMIDSCLSQVQQLGFTSIAFPTIGGGKFNYPSAEVADCFRQCVAKYPGIKVTVVSYGGELCYAYKKHFGMITRSRQRKAVTRPMSRSTSKRQSYSHKDRAYSAHHSALKLSSSKLAVQTEVIKLLIYTLEKMNGMKAMHEIYKHIVPLVYKQTEVTLPKSDGVSRTASSLALQYGCKADIKGDKIRLSGSTSRVEKAEKAIYIQCFNTRPTVQKPDKTESGYTLEALKKIKKMKGVTDYLKALSEEKILVPDYWKNSPKSPITAILMRGNKSKQCELVDLNTNSSSYNEVQNLVMKTWNSSLVGTGKDAVGLSHSNILIQKIQRVENFQLYRDYATKRSTLCMKAVNGKFSKVTVDSSPNDPEMLVQEVNEVFLFHGTSRDKLQGLVSSGIDDRLSGESPLFGRGAYFAESATKADQYADPKRGRMGRGQPLCMIISRVLLGNVFHCQNPQPFKRAPCTVCQIDGCAKGHELHDSVLGTHKSGGVQLLFREFVIYDKAQCYPEFVIEYIRQ